MGSNHPAVGFEMPSSFFMSKAAGSGDFEMIHSTSIELNTQNCHTGHTFLTHGPFIMTPNTTKKTPRWWFLSIQPAPFWLLGSRRLPRHWVQPRKPMEVSIGQIMALTTINGSIVYTCLSWKIWKNLGWKINDHLAGPWCNQTAYISVYRKAVKRVSQREPISRKDKTCQIIISSDTHSRDRTWVTNVHQSWSPWCMHVCIQVKFNYIL